MINALFYAALVRLLIATDKPFLCSSLYAFLILAMGFLSVQAGQPPIAISFSPRQSDLP